MKIQIQLLLLAASLLIAAPLRAQIVNDGATNTLSNVTNFFPGNVTIGTSDTIFATSSSNLLVVSDGAALVSAGSASVAGYGNQVFITGPGSRWANQSDFTFGGTSNRLEVSDGATLISSNATITDLT